MISVSFEKDFCIAAPDINVGSIIIHWFEQKENDKEYKCNSKLSI